MSMLHMYEAIIVQDLNASVMSYEVNSELLTNP